MAAEFMDQLLAAEEALRGKGERITQPRVAVLSMLMSSDHAVSHLDVAHAISLHKPVDRVTVYRVLEWLTQLGLAHRIACDDRVWRFMFNAALPGSAKLAEPNQPHEHAHFTCTQCGHMSCLESVSTKLQFQLPKGFKTQEIDLMLRGVCAACSKVSKISKTKPKIAA
jgi:Fur family transcriptional regulator, ferric uptake regulator